MEKQLQLKAKARQRPKPSITWLQLWILSKIREGKYRIPTFYPISLNFHYCFRWLVIDHKWNGADGRKIRKMVIISYAPESCDKMHKVFLSTHQGAFKDSMPKAVNDARQINEFDQVNAEYI